ncbi:hypothetical protein IMF23_04255 [Chelatococcus daeguensis]|uniref:pyocin knob domain-containing protein n=1 Tax=Chelatococcus daeguensis TaxID=444444 RepID=UPI0007AC26D7|nr:pyocin knob domain-containing protein [Chelatococcus daeguensis]KZE34091.1 hypothetical protein AVW15_17405 [Chelatococcus daeguensis]MBM3082648.1 hypothetical protein [Chelatococcus daeguensis]
MPRGIPIVALDLLEVLTREYSVPMQRYGDPAGRATIGQILALAAAAVELPGGTDFDSVAMPGVYILTSDVHAPFAGARWFLTVRVDPFDPGARIQRAEPITGGSGPTAFARRSAGDIYSEWVGGDGGTVMARDVGWDNPIWFTDETDLEEVIVSIGLWLNDPWAMQPLGKPIDLMEHIAGVPPPPTDRGYRYVKLTAGLTGAGGYNEGCLASESVSGSAPYINATAVISLAGSPLEGQTIRLLNTEGRFLRRGSSGVLQDDQIKSHSHGIQVGGSVNGSFVAAGNPYSDVRNTQAFGGDETRPRNMAVPAYMRIK